MMSEAETHGTLMLLRRPIVLLPLALTATVTIGGLIWWLVR